MHVYRVGEPYHPGRTSWPELVEYHYRGGSHEIRAFLRGLTTRELDALTKGPAEFALYTEGSQIFLLYQFRDAKWQPVIPWSDAPFTIHRVPDDERILPPDEEGHALVQLVIVDAATGILRGMRAFTWSPEFTRAIHDAIRAQAALPWDSAAYDRELSGVMSRLASAEMARLAQARTTAGET